MEMIQYHAKKNLLSLKCRDDENKAANVAMRLTSFLRLISFFGATLSVVFNRTDLMKAPRLWPSSPGNTRL